MTPKTKYGIGLDMQCRRVITTVQVVERRQPDEHGRDCVILTEDGIRMIDTESTLFDTEAEARRAL